MSKNLLAIDTSTEACSVALYADGDITSNFEVCPQQHSQKILPFIDDILGSAKIKISQLDAICYGCGPGSFTGVRIAASTVQGLALAHDLPVIDISTMAAMAYENYQLNKTEHTYVLIDARMQEVYFSEYVCNQETGANLQGKEQVIPPDKLANLLSKVKDEQLAGTGVIAYSEQLGLKNLPLKPKVLYPNAKFMLDLALQRLMRNQVGFAKDVSPAYVRDTVTWKKLPGRE